MIHPKINKSLVNNKPVQVMRVRTIRFSWFNV